MFKKFNLLFITFFHVGKIKYAPGTLASLITCLLFFLLVNIVDIVWLFFLTLAILFYSFSAINSSHDLFDSKDPQEIVIDEVVGQLLVLLGIPIYETLFPAPLAFYFLGAFLSFRIFDILKPFPINYIDKNTEGSFGIMFDDIVASIYAILSLLLIFFFLGG
jgi:phosphatidylglycerophosphatase A